MTRYEELLRKANLVIECAKTCENEEMREIWLKHYDALIDLSLDLKISEAKRKV